MTKRGVLAATIVLLLVAMNWFFYSGRFSVGEAEFTSENTLREAALGNLAEFTFPTEDQSSQAGATRDLFALNVPEEVVVISEPKPAIVAPENTGPDPREVAMEAARVNMLNVRVTGILSSQSGLSVLVNAPFFNGVAFTGTDLGNGISVSMIRRDRIKIEHSDLELIREIMVLE